MLRTPLRRLNTIGLATLGVSGVLALSAATALAAAPEEPATEAASAVTGTTATLHGELNPHTKAVTGYEFAYNTNGTCTEGSTTEPGTEAEVQASRVSASVTGLEGSTEYTFCVVATHLEGEVRESTFGVPLNFKTSTVAPAVTSDASGVTPFAAVLEAQVNPENQETTCKFEYSTEPLLTTGTTTVACPAPLASGAGSVGTSVALTGLTENTLYHFRVVATNGTGTTTGTIGEFTTAITEAPTVASQSVSAVTQTSATLNATIHAGTETSYHFEYGTSSAYGTSVPVPDAALFALGPVVVGQELTDLQPGTTYHYRVITSNPIGQDVGSDQTFTTPPLQPPFVSTGQASGVAQGAATLTGTVDTEGFETVYEFDIGTDTSYGTRIFGDAGVQAGAQIFTVSQQGLVPGATYHYRVVAINIFGTSYGADQTFTTPTFPTALVVGPPATPLIVTQPVTFPAEVKTSVTTKALTRIQKLASALKACRKKPKKQHATCEKQARKLYGLAQNKASRASGGNHRNHANGRDRG